MSDDEERVSLAGIGSEEALRALLKVDPNSVPVEDEPLAEDVSRDKTSTGRREHRRRPNAAGGSS